MRPSLSLVPHPDETIEGSARALREGRTTCVGLVERCLAAIEAWEPEVKAWVVVDRDGALAQARRLDRELADGRDRGPRHGIPIGVKDVIDAKGLPTRAGASRWSSGPAVADTRIVETYRDSGAVILGKTATTPYAFIDPPPTRNPWNLNRTPGGSSSGSAVAVATGMCLAAIGTQTAGSLTRPASYCGVSSLKFRQWVFSGGGCGIPGVVPLAPSLDAIGVMARTVRDLDLLRFPPTDPADSTPPRLGRLRGLFQERAETEMRSAFERAATLWREAGAEVVEVPIPDELEASLGAVRTIMAAEAAAFHGARFEADPDDYPPRIAGLIREGLALRATDYVKAIRLRRTLATTTWDAIGLEDGGDFDALVVPAAPGAAPGRETTGDPAFNAPWNFLDCETMSFPIGLSADGMPLAAQFAGSPWTSKLPDHAVDWCERVIQKALSSERG